MARLPRLTLPGYPHHVIQRGNNRGLIVNGPADAEMLLSLLASNARRFDVAVHAYVLMPNHFHLLATPQADGLPLMMQAVGRSYVRYFNDLYGRSGTLWEGRFRSTLIQPERYLLTCMAYLDLNPLRSAIAGEPGDYLWSSYRHYAGIQADRLVTPHALIWALANTPFAREAAYVKRVSEGVDPLESEALTRSALSGWPLGDAQFVTELEKIAGRRVQIAKPGRPARPGLVRPG